MGVSVPPCSVINTIVAVVMALIAAPVAALPAGATQKPQDLLILAEAAGRIEMARGGHKLVFEKGARGYALTTYVKEGGTWRASFDAGRPVLSGPLFGDLPSSARVVSNTSALKTVELTGRHAQPEYDWTMRVSASAAVPMFHFTLRCRLREPLLLDAPQPVVALWTAHAEPSVRVDQGPDSIYGAAGIPHGYGFPAAYLWRDRIESAVFFNMTPMRWMQRDGVARFHDVRIMTQREGDHDALGLHLKRLSGRRIPAGNLDLDFYLYEGIRAAKPSTLAALDLVMRRFAPLHPAASKAPIDQLTGQPASWDHVALQAIADLMKPGVMAEVPAPWHDTPVELVRPQESMVVHSAAVQAGSAQVAAGWDFSTVNNHLTPWLLLSRLRGNEAAWQIALRKVNALPRFYDPKAGLIRHGTRLPEHVGDLEMCWQNLFFHQETIRAAAATGRADFNPAVEGRFLMATAGIRELAHNVDYVFPQWFDPYRKQPVTQQDLPKLGVVREPWQAGSYAYLMMKAFEMTSDPGYLREAEQALDTLMERMRYRVKNEVYDREYTDPGGFPITELFGNAYGIAASYQLYKATGLSRYLRYSRDFLNTLLRLTPWYEDETDPISRELHVLGLFFPHCGAHVVTPWETAEAHLMLVWVLKHDPDNPLRELLLKLANLNRTNSFYFYPACWTETVRAYDAKPRSGPGMYFPIEPFYSLEGEGGHRGPTAAYMASLGLWNDWMFEALARADDPEILALNLDAMDGYEDTLQAVERNFIVYNPTPTGRTCTVRFFHLPNVRYDVTIGTKTQILSAQDLRKGIIVRLPAGGDTRITVRCSDWRKRARELDRLRQSRNAISRSYQKLEEKGEARPEEVRAFADAMHALRSGRKE